MKKYDKRDKNSIYEYALKLIGKNFREIRNDFYRNTLNDTLFISEDFIDEDYFLDSYDDVKRKGGLGELLEEMYFGYKPDNLSQPDFNEANLELKVTPYKINKNNTLSAKERLVISMISYSEIVNQDFYNSSVWNKLANILLIYYLWEEEKEKLDYIINYVYPFSPSKQDLKIIISDYNKIKQQVLEGKAHELSESDTLYLGAVTKAADSSKRTSQPFSNIPAKPRAFSLKTSYMTALLREKISKVNDESIIKDILVDDFESYIVNKINENKNKTSEELFHQYFGTEMNKSKHKYNLLTYKMLGVNTENALEFEKANIVVKTIRVENNETIKESMSFPAFKVMDLIKEEWEESSIFNYFSNTRFLFVVYKKVGKTYVLHGSMFWHMPSYDLENIVFKEWQKAQNIFKEGVKFKINIRNMKIIISTNLPKLSNTEILHVRNHSQKSAYLISGIQYGNGYLKRDSDLLPNGDMISKQCFWLNNKYILKQIKKLIQKP